MLRTSVQFSTSVLRQHAGVHRVLRARGRDQAERGPAVGGEREVEGDDGAAAQLGVDVQPDDGAGVPADADGVGAAGDLDVLAGEVAEQVADGLEVRDGDGGGDDEGHGVLLGRVRVGVAEAGPRGGRLSRGSG